MNIKFLPNRNVDFSYAEPSFCIGEEKTSSGLFCRDPFILVCNGKYYLYKNENNKIVCLVGDDLEHWSKPIVVFDPPKDFHGIKDIFWAPECHFYKGNFYIFTSVYSSIFNHRVISVYRADNPLGPFEDIAGGCISPKDWDAIDGTLYIDGNGDPWMIFVHEWTSMPDRNGGMVAARISEDMTHLVTEPVELFRAKDAPWATWGVTDGPYVFRTESGLFMIWSNFCKNGYAVGLAKSETGEICGKWQQFPQPLYEKGANDDFVTDGGHAMIFEDLSGKVRLALHGPNAKTDNETEHLMLFYLNERDGIPHLSFGERCAKELRTE